MDSKLELFLFNLKIIIFILKFTLNCMYSVDFSFKENKNGINI